MLLSAALAVAVLAVAAEANRKITAPPKEFAKLEKRLKATAVECSINGRVVGWCIVHPSGFATDFDPSIYDDREEEAPWYVKSSDKPSTRE